MKNKRERLICRLKQMRQSRGLSQTQMAELVGVKRQAIYDIESGRYLPNTEVALRLARHLACRVEDLFSEEAHAGDRPVMMVEGAAPVSPRITVARVRDRLVGYPLEGASSFGQGFRPADGLLGSDGKTVKLFEDPHRLERTAMLLGCDPAFGILASHVTRQKADVRLSCRFASSEQALKRLAAGADPFGCHPHAQYGGRAIQCHLCEEGAGGNLCEGDRLYDIRGGPDGGAGKPPQD